METVRRFYRSFRVRFSDVVEAVFSSEENRWSDLLTDSVAGAQILIYPYFYPAHRAKRCVVVDAVVLFTILIIQEIWLVEVGLLAQYK